MALCIFSNFWQLDQPAATLISQLATLRQRLRATRFSQPLPPLAAKDLCDRLIE